MYTRRRPKRERKIPAHLQSGDFESAFVDRQKQQHGQKSLVKTTTDQTEDIQDLHDKTSAEEKEGESKDENKKEEDVDDDDDMASDDDFNSEDDPERLWCICKQPHNNRFMICCDTCLEWFHGKCVGISKDMGKEMEEAGNEWRCPKCKEDKEAAQNEVKRQELAQKLKEREEEKKKKGEPSKKKRPPGLPSLKRTGSKDAANAQESLTKVSFDV